MYHIMSGQGSVCIMYHYVLRNDRSGVSMYHIMTGQGSVFIR